MLLLLACATPEDSDTAYTDPGADGVAAICSGESAYDFPADDGAHIAGTGREEWGWALLLEDAVDSWMVGAAVEQRGAVALSHLRLLRISDGRLWSGVQTPGTGGGPAGFSFDGQVLSAQGAEGREVLRGEVSDATASDGTAGAGVSLLLDDAGDPMEWGAAGDAGSGAAGEQGYARSRARLRGELTIGEVRRAVTGSGWATHRWSGAESAQEADSVQSRLWIDLEDGRQIRLELPPLTPDEQHATIDAPIQVQAQVRDAACEVTAPIASVRIPEDGPYMDNLSGCAWPEYLEVEIDGAWLRLRPLWYRPEQAIPADTGQLWALETPVTVSGEAEGSGFFSGRCVRP